MVLLQKRLHSDFPTVFKIEKPLSHQQCYPQKEPAKYFFPKRAPQFILTCPLFLKGDIYADKGQPFYRK